MTTPNSAITVQTPQLGLQQILPADASGLKTIYAGATNTSKVSSLMLSSSDTAARDVQFGVSRGGVFFPLGTISVPATAGQVSATPAVNGFTVVPGLPVDNDGQPYIFLETGDTLDFKALTTVTAAKAISAAATAGDF